MRLKTFPIKTKKYLILVMCNSRKKTTIQKIMQFHLFCLEYLFYYSAEGYYLLLNLNDSIIMLFNSLINLKKYRLHNNPHIHCRIWGFSKYNNAVLAFFKKCCFLLYEQGRGIYGENRVKYRVSEVIVFCSIKNYLAYYIVQNCTDNTKKPRIAALFFSQHYFSMKL